MRHMCFSSLCFIALPPFSPACNASTIAFPLSERLFACLAASLCAGTGQHHRGAHRLQCRFRPVRVSRVRLAQALHLPLFSPPYRFLIVIHVSNAWHLTSCGIAPRMHRRICLPDVPGSRHSSGGCKSFSWQRDQDLLQRCTRRDVLRRVGYLQA